MKKRFTLYKGAKKDAQAHHYSIEDNVVKGVEIFRTGVFRKREFKRDDLEAMKENFYELKDKDVFRNVPVRADHPDPIGLRNRMKDLIGYFKGVYLKENGKITVGDVKQDEEGNEKRYDKEIDDVRLLADIEITEPDALAKIKRTTYRDRSIEWGTYPDNDGNVYEPVLLGMAFVDIPQVDKLASLFNKEGITDVTMLDADELEEATGTGDDPEGDKDDPKDAKEAEGDKGEAEDTKKPETSKEDPENEDEEVEDTKEPEDKEEESGSDKEVEDDKEESGSDKEVEDDKEESEEDEEEEGRKELDKKLEKLTKRLDDNEIAKHLSKTKAYVGAKKSTPAMNKLELELVKSMFATHEDESYLTPQEQFDLFTRYKASMPEVWAKKEDFIKVDDKDELEEHKQNVEKEFRKKTEEQEKVADKTANDLLEEAGLRT